MLHKLLSPYYLVVLLMCVVSVSCGSNTVEGNPQDGERWFTLYRCNGCHGPHGKGGKGPDLAGLTWSAKQFRKKIRSSDSAIMPSYDETRIPNQDIADLYSYLRGKN